MKEEHITGVLLAGGKSRRMGKDKRHLLLNGKSLFDRSLDVLVEIFPEVIVVLGQEDFSVSHSDVRVVYDLIPNRAAAGGIYTGLHNSSNSSTFVVACDMPFLNADLIRYMVSMAVDFDITYVELPQGPQTMHAIYSKRCLPFLENMVKWEKLRVQELFQEPSLKVKRILESEIISYDKHCLSFMNLNSPSDFEMARKILGTS